MKWKITKLRKKKIKKDEKEKWKRKGKRNIRNEKIIRTKT